MVGEGPGRGVGTVTPYIFRMGTVAPRKVRVCCCCFVFCFLFSLHCAEVAAPRILGLPECAGPWEPGRVNRFLFRSKKLIYLEPVAPENVGS